MLRKRLFALGAIPILSLFSAVTLADVSGAPAKTIPGDIQPVLGEIKNAKACGDASFFKNQFPSLTNGTSYGSRTIDFIVDGKTVPMTVSWDTDNSFSFSLTGGYAKKIGVTVDTNNFIYDYTGQPAKGVADGKLNYYVGQIADDVNHLDLCLEPLDNEPPQVGIRVEPSYVDGEDTIISGAVDIIATVEDESLPLPGGMSITIISTDPEDPDDPVNWAQGLGFSGPVGPTDCDPVDPICAEYTWSWDTKDVPPGEYRITVLATDSSILFNTSAPKILVVNVVTAAINCLEGLDGTSGGEDGTVQGCNPSGFQWVELPDELKNTNLLDGQTLTQAAVLAKAEEQTGECGGNIVNAQPLERQYPLVAPDPRWDNGVYTARELDLSEVFQVPVGVAVMRPDTRGEPCLALIYGEASFSFADFYHPDGETKFGAYKYTYAITQLPKVVPGLSLSTPTDIGPLSPDQKDLQKVPEATYQPTNRFLETFIPHQLGPFTNHVFNPQRAKTPDTSYYALGTVQICEELIGTTLTGTPYYEAVLQCSIDLAVEYFDDLDLLLTYTGFPSLSGYEACLIYPTVDEVRVELNKARSMIKVGDWTKARTRLLDLKTDVEQATWLVDDRNCPGHVLMRIENLLWRNDQLEYAESLIPAP